MLLIESFAKSRKPWALLAIIAMTASCGDDSDPPKDDGGNQAPADGSAEADASTDVGRDTGDAAKTDVAGDASTDARANDANGLIDARREDSATCPGTGTACELCGYANCCAEYSVCAMDATCLRAARDYAACQADAADGTACLDAFAKVSRIAESYAGCLVDSCDMPCRIQH
jgi:hypothetical protein